MLLLVTVTFDRGFRFLETLKKEKESLCDV